MPRAQGRARVAIGTLVLPLRLFTWSAGVLRTFDPLLDVPTLARGQEAAFDPIRRLALGAARLVLYRTNRGAACTWVYL